MVEPSCHAVSCVKEVNRARDSCWVIKGTREDVSVTEKEETRRREARGWDMMLRTRE